MSLKKAAAVQMAARYSSVVFQLAVTMVLARILTPDEYGVMSVVTVLLGLFTVMSNAGVNAAVIQYRDLTVEDLSGLLSFTGLLGAGMAIVFCALSVPISILYGNPEYVPLMCAAAPGVICQSLNMVPDGVLIRDQRFVANGVRTVVASIIAGIAAIVLALFGWGVYALAANTVLQSLVIVTWNLVASGLRPGALHFGNTLRKVGRFSINQLASQIAQYLVRNLDNLLVGYFMGSSSLGFYDKAYKLAKYPIDYVPSTVNPVLKSFFSAKQNDRDALYSSFLRVQSVLAAIGAFLGVFCYFSAGDLISVLYGDQWAESAHVFALLSLSLPFQLINFTVFAALEGLKRTDLLLRYTGISSVLMVVLLVAGLATGKLDGVGLGVSAAFILCTPLYLDLVVKRGFRDSVKKYVVTIAPPFAAAAVMAIVYVLVGPMFPEEHLWSLIAKVLLGGAVYVALLLLPGKGKYASALIGKG